MDELYLLKENLDGWVTKHIPSNKDLVSVNDLIDVIEQLDSDLESVKEEFEEYKQNVDENYRQVSYASQVDYNPNDFH